MFPDCWKKSFAILRARLQIQKTDRKAVPLVPYPAYGRGIGGDRVRAGLMKSVKSECQRLNELSE